MLLTGATGYVGGRLGPKLLDRGWEVVSFVREPRKLEAREWSRDPRAIVARGDVADTDALTEALAGCDAAFYLVHSMEAGNDDFSEQDRRLAESFAEACRRAGVGRIIYLGGLGEAGASLSEHLRSRHEVERILKNSGVPTTSFRAAIILGSGSVSFETLRYLVERLPVMVTPRWVRTRCQPISIVDVLGYLRDCLDAPATIGKSYEIGGPEVITYEDLMQTMARALGLPRRIIVPLPVLTPTLSSLWIGLVTPVSPAIARPLAEGLRNEVIVRSSAVDDVLPRDVIDPRQAIERALEKIRESDVSTRWSVAGPMPGDPDWAGGKVFVDARTIEIDATPDAIFAAVCRVGGGHGWYAADFLWRLRGLLDQLAGGPGLRRGRRHPETVEYGETLDFWRVTDIARPRELVLRAEMKLPGTAELSFRIDASDGDSTRQCLTMTARFRPKGLLGLAYWYAVLPLHHFVFSGMLRGMRRTAIAIESGAEEPPVIGQG